MWIWIEKTAATFIVAAVFFAVPASCQAISAPPQASAESVAANPLAANPLAERDSQYLELVTIGARISQAAAADCPGAIASPGFVFDRPDQYASDQRAAAGFADQDPSARVIAVAPGSAAAEAGLRPGDRLDLPAAGASAPPRSATAGTIAGIEADVSTIEARIAAAGGTTWSLPIRRDGIPIVLAVPLRAGCGGWFDIKATPRFDGVSTRRWIQVTQGLLAAFAASPDALAFVVAHEMGHRVRRLAHDAGGCGPNCEKMADRMGLVYMARAGYDPAAALTVLATILRDGTWLDGLSGRQAVNADRLACLRVEVAQLAGAPPAPGPTEMVAPACRPFPDPKTVPSTQ